jgi:CRP-like cAMP-binding protein
MFAKPDAPRSIEIRVRWVQWVVRGRREWRVELADDWPLNEVPPRLEQVMRASLPPDGSPPRHPVEVWWLPIEQVRELTDESPRSDLVDRYDAAYLRRPSLSPDAILDALAGLPAGQLGHALHLVEHLPHWPFLTFESPAFVTEIHQGKARQRWREHEDERERRQERARREAREAPVRLAAALAWMHQQIDGDALRESLGIPRETKVG